VLERCRIERAVKLVNGIGLVGLLAATITPNGDLGEDREAYKTGYLLHITRTLPEDVVRGTTGSSFHRQFQPPDLRDTGYFTTNGCELPLSGTLAPACAMAEARARWILQHAGNGIGKITISWQWVALTPQTLFFNQEDLGVILRRFYCHGVCTGNDFGELTNIWKAKLFPLEKGRSQRQFLKLEPPQKSRRN